MRINVRTSEKHSRASLGVWRITEAQAEKIRLLQEGQFSEAKPKVVTPSELSKHISAFANSDGGDLYIGIAESVHGPGKPRTRTWDGFANQEAANGHIQAFEKLFPLGMDFQYEFIRCDTKPGLVLHVQVNKTKAIVPASNNIPYLRRGAQSLPQDTIELLKRLEYAKGIATFETEVINAPKESVTESSTIKKFIKEVIPSTTPEPWLKKQSLLRNEQPTVAGAVLYADEPQALIPKRCGVKIYRYKTKDVEGSRDTLAFTPKTVEGALYEQIRHAVSATVGIVESIPKMGEGALQKISYPQVALHEIITNALIHRDYSIADDVHIRIFDNRVEVESPGRLPAHITVKNILKERFSRNGAVVRLLNKFPDPPNQDVGEGLNTAFDAMHKLGLKEPRIYEKDNSVIVDIRHEPLASPEEAIMDYLETHETINNRAAREITYIHADHKIKAIFSKMTAAKMIEQVPNTRTSSTCYRKVVKKRA